jgi:UDP-glucose 4-epimerase
MKILVTGGAGFVGTNLIRHLVEKCPSCKITSVDNYSTGKKENHQKNCEYIKQEICNLNLGKKFDVIFHLAATARIAPSIKNPYFYIKNNISSTESVVDFASKNKTRLIYVGSSSHHGGKFKNPYTFSKEIGEEITKLYQLNYGLNASVARLYSVYGEYESTEENHSTLIGKWKRKYIEKKPFEIYGDGSKKRDFTNVKDIVEGLYLIMKKEKFGKVFEFGRGENHSVLEVAKMFDYNNIIYKRNKEEEMEETFCDYSLAKKELGWTPRFDLKDYINEIKDKDYFFKM